MLGVDVLRRTARAVDPQAQARLRRRLRARRDRAPPPPRPSPLASRRRTPSRAGPGRSGRGARRGRAGAPRARAPHVRRATPRRRPLGRRAAPRHPGRARTAQPRAPARRTRAGRARARGDRPLSAPRPADPHIRLSAIPAWSSSAVLMPSPCPHGEPSTAVVRWQVALPEPLVASHRFEDGPLRRRRPAPAPRDPAREGARRCASSRSTATPRRSGCAEADVARGRRLLRRRRR